jgi:hypothetical protein
MGLPNIGPKSNGIITPFQVCVVPRWMELNGVKPTNLYFGVGKNWGMYLHNLSFAALNHAFWG